MADLDRLMSATFWKRAVLVIIGFVVPLLLERAIESRQAELGLPGEAYGAGIAVAFQLMTKGENRTYLTVGSGGYVVDQLATRFGIRQALIDAVTA